MFIIKALLVLFLTSFSLAEPLWVLQSIPTTLPTPPPEVTGTKQLKRWQSSHTRSIEDAWSSYMDADPTKHKHANAEMHDFAATATWADELPDWVTATTGGWYVLTATPSWFSELPEDVQSIKLERECLGIYRCGQDGIGSKRDRQSCSGVVGGCRCCCSCDVVTVPYTAL